MWACWVMRFMAALFTKMLTDNMLLSVFFLTSALAACSDDSHLFITAPLEIEALSGSCLQIPCNFSGLPRQAFDSRRTTIGVWIKNDHRFKSYPRNVIFNSGQTVNTYPMNITGNLSQNDCTTLFSSLNTTYTDKYFFRIENGPFSETAFCDPVQITVKDSPPSPRIAISGELKEKESVTITCSAFTPCPHSPPKLTWNLQQDAHNKIEENADRTFSTKIQKIITLSDKHDGYNITCSSSYSVNEGQNAKSAEEKVTLSVSYSPKDTAVVISPTSPGSVGSVVNMTCFCRANPPVVNFTWMMINDGRLELIKYDQQVYSFNVTSSDRDRLYYCGCQNSVDIQFSSGYQFIFEGDEQSGKLVDVHIILKTVGIVILVSTVIIFEWWFRTRRSTKPVKDTVEAVFVNGVMELSS
ncbi:myelin-associated glycoprotein-like [Thunnus maccoyii]|uniref:myelin-associated glycoprotein-like n=1 Tax=Thunnus maccoyii TaxID=8240 RepID=UPI001C4D8673|nr:myelin-associated glycoprotein-like [Thunnus maccoyii]